MRRKEKERETEAKTENARCAGRNQ